MGDWSKTAEKIASFGSLQTVNGYVVAADDPTCWMMNSDPSVIDCAIVSNWFTPVVRHVQIDEHDPYQPHQYVTFQMDLEPVMTTEINAVGVRDFLGEKAMCPLYLYRSVIDMLTNVPISLADHASIVMDGIEAELISKMHV